MKTKLFGFCLVGLIGMINGAYATGESTAATSQKYVDDALAGKQAIMPTKATTKIVTYGATDGAMGERDTVEEWDGVTSSTTGLITVNAIGEPLGEKQNKILNLPSSNVVTHGTYNGQPGSRHIYSSTNTFGDGLVDASTLNTAIATAARAKFTRVDENGDADANGALWQINTVAPTLTVSKTLDATINGTSYCYRSLNGTNDYDGQCSVTTKTAIGASGSKTGKWGTVFPYGEVVGHSVCSTIAPASVMQYDTSYEGDPYYNWGYIASGADATTLDTQFNAQTTVGTPASDDYKYCWCKLDAVNGTPAVSRWVFASSISSASDCAVSCAANCGPSVQFHSGFRSGVFGSVAP